MIDVGSRLGSYEIVARLKAGGMATLYLGRRQGAAGFARHLAVKVVHPHLASDPSFVQMFVDEALLSSQIQHPNVVHVEELGEADGTYFIAMEYVHGCALSELLTALAKRQRRLSPELAVWIACQVAEGLHAAHETRGKDGQPLNVVHRDVSPQNVLLSAGGHVKLIDFGIAKAQGRQRTATGALKGKISYMSPEQAYGKPIDRRADVYALGVVLWEMLSMRRLFKADNDFALLEEVRNPRVPLPSVHAPDVRPELDAAVLHALSASAEHRPNTARELRAMLAQALPSVGSVDSSDMAEVLNAVLGDALLERRNALPESLSGLKSVEDLAAIAQMAEQEAMETFTVSAPEAAFTGIDDSSPPVAIPDLRSALRSDAPPFPPSTPPPRRRGSRLLVGAVALLVAAGLGGAAVVALRSPSVMARIRGLRPETLLEGSPEEELVISPSLSESNPAPTQEGTSEPEQVMPLDAGSPAADAVAAETVAPPTPVQNRGPRRGRGSSRMRAELPAEQQPAEMDQEGTMSLVEGVPIFDDDF